MSELWTRAFWVATTERAIRTFAGTLAGLLGGDAINLQGVSNMDFVSMLQVSGLAAGVAVLLAVSTHGVTKTGPSLTTAETLSPPAPSIPVQ